MNHYLKVLKRVPVESLCRQLTSVAIGIGYSLTIKTVM